MKTTTLNLPEETLNTLLWALGNAHAEASRMADETLLSMEGRDVDAIKAHNLWAGRSFDVVRTIDILHNVLAVRAFEAYEAHQTAHKAAVAAGNAEGAGIDAGLSAARLAKLAKATEVTELAAYRASNYATLANKQYLDVIAIAKGEAK
jgi:hypothetical protein